MEKTIEKLNQNRLLELTEEEYENIQNNAELLSLFLLKIKEGHPFCIRDAGNLLEEYLFDPIYMKIIFERIKTEGPKEFYELMCISTEKMAEELLPEQFNALLEYKQENYETLEKEIAGLQINIDKISDERIIKYIINNKIEFHYGSIYIDPVTPEFEELLIEALERNRYKRINTISEKIFQKCAETKQLEALSEILDTSNQEMINEIIEGLKNNEIQVSKLGYNLQTVLKHKPEYLRAVIIQNHSKHYNFDEEALNIKELRDVIIECLPNNPELAQDWCLRNNAESHLDLYLELIKYFKKDQLKELGSWNSSQIVALLQYDENNTIQNLLYALERNLDDLNEILYKWLNENYSGAQVVYSLFKYNEFTEYILKRYSIEKLLIMTTTKTYDRETGTYQHIIPEEIYKALETARIKITKVPENFEFKSTLPENVWAEIIRALEAERLTPENINIERFKNSEAVIEALLTKLAEFKSNKFNSILEKYSNELNLNTKSLEIINRTDNPLNLNTTQKIQLLPKELQAKTENIIKIIDNADKLTSSNIAKILQVALTLEKPNEVNKLLSHLFNSNKIIIDENTIQSLISFTSDIIHIYYLTKDNPERAAEHPVEIAFSEQLRNFLLKQGPLPLRLTTLYDEEVRRKTTFSDPSQLSTNPNLFICKQTFSNIDTLDRDYLDFLLDCIKKNIPINIKVLHNAYNAIESINLKKRNNTDTVDTRIFQSKNSVSDIDPLVFYSHKNIVFDKDHDTYQIISKLFEQAQPPEIRTIIDNWITNELDCHVFDAQLQNYNQKLISELIRNEKYIPYVINAIKYENIDENLVISNFTLELLLADIDEKTNNLIKETIDELIKKDKINQFDFSQLQNNSEYINITNPTFVEYIKNSVVSITDLFPTLELFLSNNTYNKFILELLEKNPEYVLTDTILNLSSKFTELNPYILESLKNNTNDWLQFHSKYLEKEYLEAYLKNHDISGVITFLVHNAESHSLLTKETSEIIKIEFLKNPEYNKEAYEALESYFGTELPTLLENNKILTLLTKDKQTCERFIGIIKPRKLDESIIISINDSLSQNYFSILYDDVMNFFTSTLEKIQRGITPEEINEVVSTIESYIPNNLEESIEETENKLLLQLYKTNKKEFIIMLIQELGNNQNIYAAVFNKITNNYILLSRNEFRSEQDIYTDTNLKFQLEKRSLYNSLFNYLAKNKPENLLNGLKQQDKMSDLNKQTVAFLASIEEEYDKAEIPKIKRNIPEMKKIIFEYFDYLNEKDKRKKEAHDHEWWLYDIPKKQQEFLPQKFEYLLYNEDFIKSVKKIPIYPKRKSNQEILSNINIESLLTFLNDDNKYNTLISILDKYRFLEWNNLFSSVIKHLSLGEEEINIFNFVNAFNSIYENEKRTILLARKRLMQTVIEDMKNNGKTQEEINAYIELKEKEPLNIQISAYKVLKYSTIYSSIANYYKIILGLEDFEIIKRNDEPYPGYGTQEERLDVTSQLALQAMEFDQVTVPSFHYEHTTKSTKKLQVTIGNRSDTRNLSHGERTKACMRAHGYAHTLFMFSNTDPRGFHIVFTDPETNEYVSRITGFRNGNTVFLNQLRHSCSSEYTDQDIIEAMFAAAKELIERSKDSEMPIENVVASPTYALTGYATQELSEHNIGKGVYDGYKDVTNNAVILATTGENGKAVNLKLDGENQPIYESVRLKPREYKTKQIDRTIRVLMQRINAIKECLENKDYAEYYKTIDFDYEFDEKEYIHAIIGQDWYVALDSSGNIIHNIAIQNSHSIEELNEALAKINEIKETKQKVGGFSNGI